MRTLYLAGVPGSGKSTIAKELLTGWEVGEEVRLTSRELFGHHLRRDPHRGVYLGVLRDGPFPGTDALSMSVAPQLEAWLEETDPDEVDFVLAEGDRLFNRRCIAALDKHTDLTIVCLTVDPEVAEARWVERKLDNLFYDYPASGDGEYKPQTHKAKATKVANLMEEVTGQGISTMTIDTTHDEPWYIADRIRRFFG